MNAPFARTGSSSSSGTGNGTTASSDTGTGAGSRLAASAAFTARAMQVGQHVMTAVLAAVALVRAVSSGTPLVPALLAALALVAWQLLGTLLMTPRSDRIGYPPRTWIVGWLFGFALVWLATVWVSAEFVWLAFVLWLLAGHLLSLTWGLLFSAVVLALVIIAPMLHHGTTTYANIFGPLIGGIFAYAISRGYLQLLRDAIEREALLSSLTQAQLEMAELQDELALAQRQSGVVEERTRLSGDIHDTIAQALSSIRLLAHAGAAQSADASAAHTLKQIEGLASDSLGDVRRIIAALAPAELEHGALAAALQRMLDRCEAECGVATTLRVDSSLPTLPTEVEVALLRTAQSALANVRLHARAERVVLSLIEAGDTVRLDIIDDGAGFDLAEWENDVSAAQSYGLRFMRTRLRQLGGGLEIETAPGEGTALSIYLPLGSRIRECRNESKRTEDSAYRRGSSTRESYERAG